MSGEILNMDVRGISILFDCLKIMMVEPYLWDVENDSTTHVLVEQWLATRQAATLL